MRSLNTCSCYSLGIGITASSCPQGKKSLMGGPLIDLMTHNCHLSGNKTTISSGLVFGNQVKSSSCQLPRFLLWFLPCPMLSRTSFADFCQVSASDSQTSATDLYCSLLRVWLFLVNNLCTLGCPARYCQSSWRKPGYDLHCYLARFSMHSHVNCNSVSPMQIPTLTFSQLPWCRLPLDLRC